MLLMLQILSWRYYDVIMSFYCRYSVVIVRYILSVEMLLGHGKKQEQWEMLVGG